MKKTCTIAAAALTAALLSGCAGAAFNRVDMTVSRNITVGQELLDLQAAHEKGVINDSEYAQAKQNVLNVLSALGEVEIK